MNPPRNNITITTTLSAREIGLAMSASIVWPYANPVDGWEESLSGWMVSVQRHHQAGDLLPLRHQMYGEVNARVAQVECPVTGDRIYTIALAELTEQESADDYDTDTARLTDMKDIVG